MQLKLRKIGNSWGVLFPMDIIREHVALGVIDIDIKPVKPKTEPKERPAKAGEMAKIMGEKITVPVEIVPPKKAPRADFYTLCPKHNGYKGNCHCK